MSKCPTCGQPVEVVERRDPPLPRLSAPNVVTIHDLPIGSSARVIDTFTSAGTKVRQVVLDGDAA